MKYLSHEPMHFPAPAKEFRPEDKQEPLYPDRYPELVDHDEKVEE